MRDDTNYATVLAWAASEAELPQARQQTHDMLIAGLGARRRSGVQWRWWTGEEAYSVLDQHLAGPTDQAAHYRRLRALLREHGGLLVMALAEGKP